MPETNEIDGGDSKVTVPSGKSTDRYVASDLIEDSDISFKSKLIIKNLQETDQKIRYRLVVNNTVGSNVYNFKVVLNEATTMITKEPSSLASLFKRIWLFFVSLFN